MEKNYIFLIRLASTIEDGGKEGVGSEGRRFNRDASTVTHSSGSTKQTGKETELFQPGY